MESLYSMDVIYARKYRVCKNYIGCNINEMYILVGIVIYLYIEGALYAQKSVPSWFLAVFDSKIDVC